MNNKVRLVGLIVGVMVIVAWQRNACAFDDCSCAFGS